MYLLSFSLIFLLKVLTVNKYIPNNRVAYDFNMQHLPGCKGSLEEILPEFYKNNLRHMINDGYHMDAPFYLPTGLYIHEYTLEDGTPYVYTEMVNRI